MLRRPRTSLCALLLAAATACTPASNDTDATSSTATGTTTGDPGTGGTTQAVSATNEATSLPTSTSSSTTADEPTSSTATTADLSTGPAETTTPETTTGAPIGSPGCGLTPASGDLQIAVQGQMGQYIVSLPPGYDPLTPYPLGFAFHGRGRTGPNCHDGDCAGFQTAMEADAVLVYMTSLGGDGWEGDGERELNVEFFQKVLDDLVAGACIDESRVFVAGTSSGAHFTNILGCRFGDRLLAIAPVAGYLPEKDNCLDKVAALVIHGFKDPHVPLSAGEEARDFWRARNGCSDTTVPTIPEVHAAAEATPESHSCAIYQGCEDGLPVHWCEHSEGGYDDSTHGWPLFGGQMIWEFVQSLP